MIDSKYNHELRLKFNPEGSPLRIAQERMLELLDFLDRICTEHKLTYWIDSGTLLGAARHGGFIPWDDDTDVCMPREDAMKLQKIMADKIHEDHVVLQSNKNDPNYMRCSWFALRDTKSEYIQDSEYHNSLKYKGLQIDIFMVDEGLNPVLNSVSNVLYTQLVLNPITGIGKSWLKKFTKFNFSVINSIINPILRRITFGRKSLSKGIGCGYYKPFSKDILYPLQKISFENKSFNAPNNIDGYLTILYGDWNKVPDVKSIHTHNVNFKLI